MKKVSTMSQWFASFEQSTTTRIFMGSAKNKKYNCMLMKCINTSCRSTRIKVINQANGSVLENGANLVGRRSGVHRWLLYLIPWSSE